MNRQGWSKVPLQFLCSARLPVFLPLVFFSSLLLGFGLTFLLVIPGAVIFLAADIQLERVFSLLCFFQVVCSALFFCFLLRLRQKLRLRETAEQGA